MLYGAPKTGKTSMCHAIAHATGATLFDLSPRNTDGKYPGKTVAMMVHMVSCSYTMQESSWSSVTLHILTQTQSTCVVFAPVGMTVPLLLQLLCTDVCRQPAIESIVFEAWDTPRAARIGILSEAALAYCCQQSHMRQAAQQA